MAKSSLINIYHGDFQKRTTSSHESGTWFPAYLLEIKESQNNSRCVRGKKNATQDTQ